MPSLYFLWEHDCLLGVKGGRWFTGRLGGNLVLMPIDAENNQYCRLLVLKAIVGAVHC